MVRVALYARYSSDLQSKASVADQLRECRAYAQRQWPGCEITPYSDAAISGASDKNRPGYQALLRDMRAKRFERVVSESLDRFTRDPEDAARLYKLSRFTGIPLMTLSDNGPLTLMTVAVKSMMGSQQLQDIADKTRRGMRGRVRDGKMLSKPPYGYDHVTNGCT